MKHHDQKHGEEGVGDIFPSVTHDDRVTHSSIEGSRGVRLEAVEDAAHWLASYCLLSLLSYST